MYRSYKEKTFVLRIKCTTHDAFLDFFINPVIRIWSISLPDALFRNLVERFRAIGNMCQIKMFPADMFVGK